MSASLRRASVLLAHIAALGGRGRRPRHSARAARASSTLPPVASAAVIDVGVRQRRAVCVRRSADAQIAPRWFASWQWGIAPDVRLFRAAGAAAADAAEPFAVIEPSVGLLDPSTPFHLNLRGRRFAVSKQHPFQIFCSEFYVLDERKRTVLLCKPSTEYSAQQWLEAAGLDHPDELGAPDARERVFEFVGADQRVLGACFALHRRGAKEGAFSAHPYRVAVMRTAPRRAAGDASADDDATLPLGAYDTDDAELLEDLLHLGALALVALYYCTPLALLLV